MGNAKRETQMRDGGDEHKIDMRNVEIYTRQGQQFDAKPPARTVSRDKMGDWWAGYHASDGVL